MKNHQKYFNILEKIAEAVEPVAKQRLASLLVYKGEVIAVGYNKMKTHPFAKQFSKNASTEYLHAEVDCIKNALRHINVDMLSKCTMYVLRVKRPFGLPHNFMRGLSKPCCGCQRAIDQFGIKKVYFTTDIGYDEL